MWHAWWWFDHARPAAIIRPVLSEVDANLRGVQPFSTELDSPINGRGVYVLHVAKHRSAALALVEANLLDFTTLIEHINNMFLTDIAWKTTNPYSPTALWLD